MLRYAIFVATALLVGCPSKQPEAPHSPEDTALRIRIAQAEAHRAAGVDELVQLATSGDVHQRELALRGLGRVGGDKARATLEASLADKDPKVVAAACYAIGVAAALDEPPDWKPGGKLVAVLAVAPLPALEALGRAGDATNQPALTAKLADKDPAIAAAAAIALGRHGRRKIAWSAEARAALATATSHADSNVRYAATYALSREHEPPGDDAVNAALIARIADEYPETRASAIAGLAKRKAVTAARKQIVESLRDRDWRVAVEAVRALAGANGDDEGRVAVIGSLSVRAAQLEKGSATEAQVIVEALRTLLDHPISNPKSIATELHIVSEPANASIPALTTGWSECLQQAVQASATSGAPTGTTRGAPTGTASGAPTGTKSGAPTGTTSGAPTGTTSAGAIEALTTCGHGALPDHLRLPLLADVAKGGDIAAKRAALRVLLAHDDPRVRAAGLNLLPETWKDSDAKGQATIVGTISSALAVKNPIVAGTAVDVAGTVYEQLPKDDALRTTLDNAILARAKTETDVELSASLYTAIGKNAIPGGADVCRGGLAAAPARAKAAADCLKALGEAAPPQAAASAELPPVDVATVIGKKLRWHLVTSRGEIVIELRPDVAPWAVASIVALTDRGFYNGLEFHRVVGNFVVQGGDPTQSGWGGPGYTLPAEPASTFDGPGYVVGGVGIADAGKDSGGSQWFIMHSRAPHLDGRYTWIGSVVDGQKYADALLIGDRVERASVER
ncbi:MAG TPA: peptidylprolyl isomerase [Kofleriaceae bacterium]|nr:peptidylprolyl isomerase [Kofleriaceae bacterium]